MKKFESFVNSQYAAAHCRSKSYNALIVFVFFLFVAAICIGVVLGMACWTDQSLDWAVSEYKGEPTDVAYWKAVVFTCLAPFALLFNIVCEILRSA